MGGLLRIACRCPRCSGIFAVEHVHPVSDGSWAQPSPPLCRRSAKGFVHTVRSSSPGHPLHVSRPRSAPSPNMHECTPHQPVGMHSSNARRTTKCRVNVSKVRLTQQCGWCIRETTRFNMSPLPSLFAADSCTVKKFAPQCISLAYTDVSAMLSGDACLAVAVSSPPSALLQGVHGSCVLCV